MRTEKNKSAKNDELIPNGVVRSGCPAAFRRRNVCTAATLAGIFLFALLLRISCHYLAPTITRDGVLYVKMIETWHLSGSYAEVLRQFPDAAWLPPLYLYLAQLLMFFGIRAETAGVALNFLFGSALSVVAYWIARFFFERRGPALAAALLMAVLPPAVDMSIEILRDPLYLFAAGMAFGFLLRAIKTSRRRYWAGAGVFFAAGILTRYEMLELLPMAAVFLTVAGLLKWLTGREVLKCSAAFLAGLLAAAVLLGLLMRLPPEFYLEKYPRRIIRRTGD